MTDNNNDDNHDDEPVGYGRPPKKHQFKKGQSGCPSGGREQKQAKAKAKAEAEKEKEKGQDKRIADIVRRVSREEISAISNGQKISMPLVEAIVRKILHKPLQADASPRDTAAALNLLKHAKVLDPPPAKGRSFVLAVPAPVSMDEWAKRTEGELLPKDPLHGIPGAEGLLETKEQRGVIPDLDAD
jgi:Family of unknown function (DUF5681)